MLFLFLMSGKVIFNAGGNGGGQCLLVRLTAQLGALISIGHEADFHQRGRHYIMRQYYQTRGFDASVFGGCGCDQTFLQITRQF